MDDPQESLKGLPSGVVLSAVFDPGLGTFNILALYSPGVRPQSGTLEQMVRWVIAVGLCHGGQVHSARAFKSLGEVGVEDLHLKAFCGSNVLYAAQKMHLLQGLGLADDQALSQNGGWDQLQVHAPWVENGYEDFTAMKCFFDEGLAMRCAAARKVLMAGKGS